MTKENFNRIMAGLEEARRHAAGEDVPGMVIHTVERPEGVARAEIHSRVEFEPNTGCWLWARGYAGNGYGTLGLRGLPREAHRASWVAHNGPIPAGLWVLHRCDTPACVNPSHLFLGTQRENMADCAIKGRIKRRAGPYPKQPFRNRNPMMCSNGHVRTAANTQTFEGGRRTCLDCRRARNRKIATSRKEARATR